MSTAAKLVVLIQGKDESKNLFNGLQNNFKSLTKTIAVVGAALTAAFAVMGKKILATGMEFDAAMRNVNAVAQLPEAQFKTLSDEVVKFSMTTRASAADVAASLYNVVSAGYDTVEGFEVMEQASRAAGAGLATTEDTSRLLIATLRSYAMPVSDAARVTDIFLQTVNEGLTTLPALSSSMGRILPIAANLGVSVEEAAFSLAKMTQTGLETSEATTRLMAMFTSLMQPTTELQAVIEELGYTSGVQFVEQSGGALAALRTLKEEGFLENTEQAAALFHNIRGLGGVLAVLSDDATTAAGAVEDFGNRAEGAVDRARTEQYKSLSAILAKIKSAFEAISLSISQAFLPTLTAVANRMVPIIRGIGANIAPIAEGVGTMFNLMARSADKFVTKIANKLGISFSNMTDASGSWGRNVILSFAQGMATAISAVIQVLNNLARVITGWLRPGSPPKLLPDLDKWGTGAMQTYMDGWGDADFGVFAELGDVLEDHVRSLSEDSMPEGNLIDAILGSKASLAEALTNVKSLGLSGADALAQIRDAFGNMSVPMESYVSALLESQRATYAVDDAQRELNETTREYDEMLSPLTDAMSALNDQKQAIRDRTRLAELQKVQGSWKATDDEKELARIEMKEIALRQQIDAVDDEKKAAVKAADDKLKAAKKEQSEKNKRVAHERKLAGIQKKQNSLLKEQLNIMESLAEKVEEIGAAEGIGDIAADIAAMGGAADAGISDITETLGETLGTGIKDSIKEALSVESITESITGMFEPVGEEFDALSETVALLWINIRTFFDGVAEKIAPVTDWVLQFYTWKDVMIGLGIAIAVTLLPAVWSLVAGIVSLMAPVLLIIGAIGALRYAWENDVGGIATTLTKHWNDTIKPALSELYDWFKVQIPIALAAVTTFWNETLLPAFTDIYDWLQVQIPLAIETAVTFWEETLLPALETVWAWINDEIVPIFADVFDWLEVQIPKAIESATEWFNDKLLPALTDIWNFIVNDLAPFLGTLFALLWDLGEVAIKALIGFLETVFGWFEDVYDILAADLGPMVEQVTTIFDLWSDSVGGLSGIVQTAIGWFNDLRDSLTELTLPDWLTPGSPTPFEIGLKGISHAVADLNVHHLPAFDTNLRDLGGGDHNQTNTFIQTINSSARQEDVGAEFQQMQAVVGGI